MADPLREHESSESRIEELLLAGLDHYFNGQHELAISVWTRVLFLDRTHARARAYIERARGAIAEGQREGEELLQTGAAAFKRGDADDARRLLTSAIERGAQPDEALSMLDLPARILPCPKGGHRFRDELIARAGKSQYPYLVDPNTGKEMYESADIVAYLFSTYGVGAPPALLMGPLPILAGAPIQLLRGTRGTFVQASRRPEQPLELWSFEASPFSRIAREKLCVLELPYLLHNVAKGSPSRGAFVARSGKMQVPYLADPNTRTEMFESADIVAYLEATYAA